MKVLKEAATDFDFHLDIHHINLAQSHLVLSLLVRPTAERVAAAFVALLHSSCRPSHDVSSKSMCMHTVGTITMWLLV